MSILSLVDLEFTYKLVMYKLISLYVIKECDSCQVNATQKLLCEVAPYILIFSMYRIYNCNVLLKIFRDDLEKIQKLQLRILQKSIINKLIIKQVSQQTFLCELCPAAQ